MQTKAFGRNNQWFPFVVHSTRILPEPIHMKIGPEGCSLEKKNPKMILLDNLHGHVILTRFFASLEESK